MPAIIDKESGLALLTSSKAVVQLNAGEFPGKTKPTSPVVKLHDGGDISFWGDDNLFPQNVIAECEKNTIIPTALDFKIRALYGAGLQYGKIEGYKENGDEIFVPDKDTAIDAFYRQSNIRRYLVESITDFYWFFNVFPEMILSKDRSKIVSMCAQEASHSRWQKQGEDGLIKKCYINANWDNGGTPENSTKVDVIDPYWDPVTATREGSAYKYIYPLSYPTPNKTYYQLAYWNSIRTSKWLDTAQAIPAFKKALMENQATVKYFIAVDREWWEWKYKNFNSLSHEERLQLMQDEVDNFDDVMTGAANAGKSIMSTTLLNKSTGERYDGWKITAIDNKLKDGIYIEDSQEASSHIMCALGVHQTLLGISPGKGLGAGSGSDQRVAFNNYISLCQLHRDLILEPFEFIRDYNGWSSDTVWRFRYPLIMTLDKGKQTQQETA